MDLMILRLAASFALAFAAGKLIANRMLSP